MSRVCILSSVHIALDNRVFYREARSLQKAGHDVTLIAVHPRSEIRDGVRIIGLPRVPRWQRPRLWRQLVRHALAAKADLYHFHDPELLFIVPWLRLASRKPAIYDIHEVYPDFFKVKDYLPVWVRYPLAWNFAWMEPVLARLQSGLIFSDDEIARNFARYRGPKTTLFNYPAREFVEQAYAETRGITSRLPGIVHLGGHERNRGTRLMIAAFEQVHQAMPAARLTLVGHFVPPALQEEVAADVRQRGLESAVTITGRVPFDSIGRYLREASVGWMPWQPYPKNEKNIPTKLFEYMAYGLPVVTSDLHSTSPFVQEGENGFRVTPADPGAHARALLAVLQDPERGAALGRRGQDWVREEYNWDKMAERLLAFYEKILAK